MDATQKFAKEKAGVDVKKFVITGVSKVNKVKRLNFSIEII